LSGKARAGSALRPVGALVMPPWTDLALSGASMQTRGAADPLLTRESLASTARLYVGGARSAGDLAGLPPVRTHLGEDEVLSDDSLRYSERIENVSGTVHSWEGTTHVFPSSVALLQATREALDDIGDVLRQQILGDVDPTGRLTKRSVGRIEGLR
jgi:acetyl esterase/lipase